MKTYNGSAAKPLTKFFTYHKSVGKAYLLIASLDVSEDPVVNNVVLTVYKNKGPFPARNDPQGSGNPTAPQPLLLKGNGAGVRLLSAPVLLVEDDELQFTVGKFGGDPLDFPNWKVQFRLAPLSDDL